MELQEIDVYIQADGQVRVEVRGVTGRACLALTAGLEAALGAEVISREMTAEAGTHSSDVAETERQRLERQG